MQILKKNKCHFMASKATADKVIKRKGLLWNRTWIACSVGTHAATELPQKASLKRLVK